MTAQIALVHKCVSCEALVNIDVCECGRQIGIDESFAAECANVVLFVGMLAQRLPDAQAFVFALLGWKEAAEKIIEDESGTMPVDRRR